MKTFVDKLDCSRIEGAIAAAELLTSGEIRVIVHRKSIPNPVAIAREEFAQLKMHETRERNGVLILVAPKSRTFAVFGDEAIHEKCGQSFWDELTKTMISYFREERFTDGIVEAIERAGSILASHFPRKPDDQNELPDSVVQRD